MEAKNKKAFHPRSARAFDVSFVAASAPVDSIIDEMLSVQWRFFQRSSIRFGDDTEAYRNSIANCFRLMLCASIECHKDLSHRQIVF